MGYRRIVNRIAIEGHIGRTVEFKLRHISAKQQVPAVGRFGVRLPSVDLIRHLGQDRCQFAKGIGVSTDANARAITADVRIQFSFSRRF